MSTHQREMGKYSVSLILPIIKEVANEVLVEQGMTFEEVPYKVGTMMELHHACIRADDIARAGVEFMSFGTNDLTQSTYGFSRDDANYVHLT
jgi:pyruvate,orthophosphate dikinase